jgi:outer membrane protein assembly factor BamB
LGSGGFSTDGLIVHDSTVYAFNNFQNLISYNFSAGNYDYTNHSGFLFYGLGKIAYGLNSIYGCTADSYFRHGVAASTSSSGWFYYVSNGFYSSIRTPIIEDTLLILSRNYYASVYNAKNGYPISETANDEFTPIVGDVSIADKVIYQANEDALPGSQFFVKGKLSAFNALTGAVKWNSPERSNFGTMPCVVTVSGKMHRGRDIY